MTEKTLRMFDAVCDFLTVQDDRMTTEEYLELLDEIRVFVAIRQKLVEAQVRQ